MSIWVILPKGCAIYLEEELLVKNQLGGLLSVHHLLHPSCMTEGEMQENIS